MMSIQYRSNKYNEDVMKINPLCPSLMQSISGFEIERKQLESFTHWVNKNIVIFIKSILRDEHSARIHPYIDFLIRASRKARVPLSNPHLANWISILEKNITLYGPHSDKVTNHLYRLGMLFINFIEKEDQCLFKKLSIYKYNPVLGTKVVLVAAAESTCYVEYDHIQASATQNNLKVFDFDQSTESFKIYCKSFFCQERIFYNNIEIVFSDQIGLFEDKKTSTARINSKQIFHNLDIQFSLIQQVWPEYQAFCQHFVKLISINIVDNGSMNSSSSTLHPFTITIDFNIDRILENIESLIHESFHQAIMLVESHALLYRNKEHEKEFNHPWRSDLRPMRGVVHAAHAFNAVLYFHSILRKSSLLIGKEYLDKYYLQLSNDVKLTIDEGKKAKLTLLGKIFYNGIIGLSEKIA